MDSVLSVSTGTRCFVDLRDIVIYAQSLAGHNIKLRELLDKPERTKAAAAEVRSSPKISKLPRPSNN
jgi:hypothetical protein